MKQWIYGLFMAWGMFLAIPCPVKVWEEAARPKMMALLPAVGLVPGGLWALAAWGLPKLNCPLPLQGLVLALIPWLTTGLLHLDGFMDVCDAVLSRRDLKTRQRILKDAHCGAFAVISMCLLTAAAWAVGQSWDSFPPGALLAVPVASRAAAALAVQWLRPMATSQYAAMGRTFGNRLWLLACLGLACGVPAFLGSWAPMAAAAGYGLSCWYGYRNLGGMSGDVSGFALTIGELVGFLIAGLVG